MKIEPQLLPYLIQEELYLIKDEKSGPISEPVKPEEKDQASTMLVVVDTVDSVSSALETGSFLSKVLAAIDLELSSIQIQSKDEFVKDSLFECRWALFFGVRDLFPGFGIPYEIKNDPCIHLVADSLLEIEAEREKKAKLWNALKAMFEKKD